MKYQALVTSTSGAEFRLNFEADNNELARDHIRMVAADPNTSLWDFHPGYGKAWVRFRRATSIRWLDIGRVAIQ